MKIMLIRHGRTEANARRLYCGATDVPLSAEGRVRLAALRDAGGYPEAAGLTRLTSGLLRANQTLEMLFGGGAAREDCRFREMNFGRFEMHSYAELKGDTDYQAWISDASGLLSTPGGESAAEFERRVLRAAAELNQDTLLVTHGGVIAALMRHWFPEEERNRYSWQPEGGCGYLVELTARRRSYVRVPDEACARP